MLRAGAHGRAGLVGEGREMGGGGRGDVMVPGACLDPCHRGRSSFVAIGWISALNRQGVSYISIHTTPDRMVYIP